MITIRKFRFNPFQERGMVLSDETGECVIVDPGCYDEAELGELTEYMVQGGLTPKAIWLTHGHFDHIYGVKSLSRKYGIPTFMSPADQLVLDADEALARTFQLTPPDTSFAYEAIGKDSVMSFGHTRFTVFETPGHTPGGVCYYDEADKVLLSGDTLFAGSIGRTDGPGGDYDKLIKSVMDGIMGLPGDVSVFPGHGPMTDIGEERTHNPFLQPFNEPDEEGDWDQDGLSIHR